LAAELLGDRLVHDDALGRKTSLARVGEGTECRRAHGTNEIGIGQDNARRFATEFEHGALEVVSAFSAIMQPTRVDPVK